MNATFNIMRSLLLTFILVCCTSLAGLAQESLLGIGTPTTIDFNGFTGSGFTSSPAVGQLDSDTFSITGLSDGILSFGGTETSGDFARGASSGGAASGGIYAFDHGGGDVGLGFQAAGSDMTPGTIVVAFRNDTGDQVNEVTVTYDIWYFNDQSRSTSFNFAWSTSPTGPFTAVSALDFSTPTTSTGGSWASVSRNTTLAGIGVANGATLYLQFSTDDASGSGNRDEIAIDDLVVTPTAVPVELQMFTVE